MQEIDRASGQERNCRPKGPVRLGRQAGRKLRQRRVRGGICPLARASERAKIVFQGKYACSQPATPSGCNLSFWKVGLDGRLVACGGRFGQFFPPSRITYNRNEYLEYVINLQPTSRLQSWGFQRKRHRLDGCHKKIDIGAVFCSIIPVQTVQLLSHPDRIQWDRVGLAQETSHAIPFEMTPLACSPACFVRGSEKLLPLNCLRGERKMRATGRPTDLS